jgi:hypothetical protein
MFLVKGILHLLVHIVAIPFRLLFELIKYVIITPVVLLLVLAILIFGCVAIAVPDTTSLIKLPGFVTDISTQFQRLTNGWLQAPQATQVTCAVRGKGIVVQWSINSSDEVKWYKVIRKGVLDMAWQRIALVQTGKSAVGLFEYSDTAIQHGTTYQYGIIVVRLDGSEGELVISPVQVVAP